jgi:hypothetical protein
VHHRDALGLDRPGEYPAAQVPLRVSAHSHLRNGDHRARRREQRRLWVLPKCCRRWLAGRGSACRLSSFGFGCGAWKDTREEMVQLATSPDLIEVAFRTP